jgi:anti-sigma factor RsiW
VANLCPDEGALHAYLDRQLPSPRQAEIAAHLEACPACVQRISGLQEQADFVYAALGQGIPVPPAHVAWQRLHARPEVRKARAALSSAGTAGVITLHPAARRFNIMSHAFRFRWQPALLGAVAAALLFCLVAVAPLRAAASNFLDVFRVRKITIVQVDPRQMGRLEGFKQQLFSNVQMAKRDATKAHDAAGATSAAGFPVLIPSYLPAGLLASTNFSVQPGGHVQAQVNLKAARALLEAAGAPTDAVPSDRDSMEISADLRPVVTQHYAANGEVLTILQGQSPVVNVPPDVSLDAVGAAGLQIMGMTEVDADAMAKRIDWATTLVLPVPSDMASVQEVTVAGTPGYLISESPQAAASAASKSARSPDAPQVESNVGPQNALVWENSSRGLIYMVEGTFNEATLQRVATSLN